MLELLQISFRNVLRNRRRSLFTILTIGLGLAALMITDSLMLGMFDSMIRSGTETFLGNGQVAHREFLESDDPAFQIEKEAQITQTLLHHPSITALSPRTMNPAMISSPANSQGVVLVGIDPQNERKVSHIYDSIIQGNYLTSTSMVMLGKDLANRLEVGLGDRIVITSATVDTNEMEQIMMRVGAIFDMHSRLLNRQMVFMDISEAQKKLHIQHSHILVLRFKEVYQIPPFQNLIHDPQLIARSWKELLPALAAARQMSDETRWLIIFVLFLIVASGIINTILTAIHERQFEFGVLRAIGARPGHLPKLLLAETFWLGLLGLPIGILIASFVIGYTHIYGLDYSGAEFMGVAIRNTLHPRFRWQQFVSYPLGCLILTILAAVIPASRLARLKPTEALRRSF